MYQDQLKLPEGFKSFAFISNKWKGFCFFFNGNNGWDLWSKKFHQDLETGKSAPDVAKLPQFT
jgi:hypothetical protein